MISSYNIKTNYIYNKISILLINREIINNTKTIMLRRLIVNKKIIVIK